MASRPVSAWGRLSAGLHDVFTPAFSDDARRLLIELRGPRLAAGLLRSYGDEGLNLGHGLIVTTGMDRLITCDWDKGVVRAEAGLSLDALLTLCVPQGWFLPVTPGTRFVTLGGAVANDVHGKNHHVAGTFGNHVAAIGLARAAGEVHTLTPADNSELFSATLGGLGLTGLILWVELRLAPIRSSDMHVETLPLKDLDAFFTLDQASQDWPYTVAWVDCLAGGRRAGQGLYMRGRHAESGPLTPHGPAKLAAPPVVPAGLLNPFTLRVFNTAYRNRPWAVGAGSTHYDPFFYPLDSVSGWNRLYGPAGFYQFQGVAPEAAGPDAVRRLLSAVAESRQGSFLTVLKRFGAKESPGLLSFPMPGVTFALDFPNRGEETLRLIRRLNDIALEAGGRIYPAKDAAMTAEQFRASYPQWGKLETLRDPMILSDYWRRVTGAGA
jgi:L-gulonolactone oxidase